MSLPLDAGPGNETLWMVWFCPKDSLGPVPVADTVVSALVFELIVPPPDSEFADAVLISVVGGGGFPVLEVSSDPVTPSTERYRMSGLILFQDISESCESWPQQNHKLHPAAIYIRAS